MLGNSAKLEGFINKKNSKCNKLLVTAKLKKYVVVYQNFDAASHQLAQVTNFLLVVILRNEEG